MSSDGPGAQEDPNKAACPHKQDGVPEKAHRWELAWDEPLGRMWVCARCGVTGTGWSYPEIPES